MTKALGVGIFSAYRQDGVVHVAASGVKPTLQTKVMIEEQPFLIFPPRYALMFETDGITSPIELPFHIEKAITNYPDVSFISIADANGVHSVDIVDKPAAGTGGGVTDPSAKNFVVYRQLNTDRYLIAKADAIVIAIYYKVFGPDTYANCQAYVAAHTLVGPRSLDIDPASVKAWIDRQPGIPNGSKLIVTVDATVEIDWTVTLVSSTPQGFNPMVKLLNFDIKLPTGPVHSNAMVKKTFRYEESPSQQAYTDVTIQNGSKPITKSVENVS